MHPTLGDRCYAVCRWVVIYLSYNTLAFILYEANCKISNAKPPYNLSKSINSSHSVYTILLTTLCNMHYTKLFHHSTNYRLDNFIPYFVYLNGNHCSIRSFIIMYSQYFYIPYIKILFIKDVCHDIQLPF